MADKGRVLVTGANGYIAARTVEAFLKAGYSVRGTVRSLSSAQEVADSLPEYADKLEFVSVPDITAPGAFDDAIRGITAVAHLASPVAFNFTDPEPVVKAAVEGTLRALESANREPSVKSVVILSSVAAVVTPEREESYTYTEADWNNQSEEVIAAKGKATPGRHIYNGSKAAAEKAFWKFREENKPAFSMTAVNPCFVIGPPLVTPTTYDKINVTNRLIPDVFIGKPLAQSGAVGVYNSAVDVRDVARLVVFGVDHPQKTDGERFIAAPFYAPAQAAADVILKAYPDRQGIVEAGTPGEGYFPDYHFPEKLVYDSSKAIRVSGKEFIPWPQSVVDTVEKLKPVLQ